MLYVLNFSNSVLSEQQKQQPQLQSKYLAQVSRLFVKIVVMVNNNCNNMDKTAISGMRKESFFRVKTSLFSLCLTLKHHGKGSCQARHCSLNSKVNEKKLHQGEYPFSLTLGNNPRLCVNTSQCSKVSPEPDSSS